jgi:hypothetical protein
VPVANAQSVTTAEDTAKAITLSGSDADGDALTYSATGLPGGVSIDPSTGVISGTPTTPAAGVVTVTLTDSLGVTQTLEVNIRVADRLAVVKKVLVVARVGRVYSARLFASGGVSPYAWGIVTGRLPAGLKLNALTGRITGKATKAGTYRFRVQVTDALRVTSTTTVVLKVVGK